MSFKTSHFFMSEASQALLSDFLEELSHLHTSASHPAGLEHALTFLLYLALTQCPVVSLSPVFSQNMTFC